MMRYNAHSKVSEQENITKIPDGNRRGVRVVREEYQSLGPFIESPFC